MIVSAIFIPSKKLDMMPPEYPAPSPAGYRCLRETDSKLSGSRLIFTTLLERVSGPIIIPWSIKPGILWSKSRNAAFKSLIINGSNRFL